MCVPEAHVNLTLTDQNPCSTQPVSAGTPVHGEMPRASDQSGSLKAPLISVCMPVYNAKRYLKEAVESILRPDVQRLRVSDHR